MSGDDHGTTGELDLDAIEAWSQASIATFRDRQEFVERTRVEVVPALVAEVRRLRQALRLVSAPAKTVTLPEGEPGVW